MASLALSHFLTRVHNYPLPDIGPEQLSPRDEDEEVEFPPVEIVGSSSDDKPPNTSLNPPRTTRPEFSRVVQFILDDVITDLRYRSLLWKATTRSLVNPRRTRIARRTANSKYRNSSERELQCCVSTIPCPHFEGPWWIIALLCARCPRFPILCARMNLTPLLLPLLLQHRLPFLFVVPLVLQQLLVLLSPLLLLQSLSLSL